MDSGKLQPWRTPKGYAASHCMQCSMGWTRTGPAGGALIVCLLDREPIPADMTNCDRFEPREAAQDEAAA